MARMLRLTVLALATATLFGLTAASTHLVFAAGRVNDLHVTEDNVNVRRAPNLTAPVVSQVSRGDVLQVTEPVQGQAVEGNPTWYRTEAGTYVTEVYTTNKPSDKLVQFDGPTPERWIDIDVSDLRARAMQGDREVYSAPIVAGRDQLQTPRGSFRIQWRAFTRTMDSSTIGIPINSEDGYLIPNVRYAQYFTSEGDAIHGNYWVEPDAFGTDRTSRGCVGMSNEDAKVFWDFASVGTRVEVHD